MPIAITIVYAVLNVLLAGFLLTKTLEAEKGTIKTGLWVLTTTQLLNAGFSLTYYVLQQS